MFSSKRYLEEFNKLKRENIMLSLELNRLKYLEEENEQLRRIIKFKGEKNLDLIPIQVIAIEPSRLRRVILAETETLQSIKENMFVIDYNGYLIGKVLKLRGRYIEVMLINDPDFTTTVKVGNSLGLLKGTLGGAIKVFYIDIREDIKEGDLVLASFYQKGIDFVIGKVKSVNYDRNSLSLDITIEPVSNTLSSPTVFVVK
ncbi:MAG: rod shape-determining protein MreC [Candidatus Omnitrophica bacterium]|nr:rod shape-determining protein MreC [Candidatus Omnitrophota bacterium]MCM8827059.1 rod shape-determining protein MreC [Candidatus Omnitrophota bacterium]